MTDGRFRWTTIQRALDVLQAEKTNAEMVALVEEIGGGPDYDRTSDRTTPKLRNLLSRMSRQPGRLDPEGMPLGDRIVQAAAATVPKTDVRPWDDEPPYLRPHHAALLNSLGVDGWSIIDGILLPTTSTPLGEKRDRLRKSLDAAGAGETLRRLDQLEAGLDDGHWESANADARGFLNSVFEVLAASWPGTAGQALREGQARIALQKTGFFKPDSKNPAISLEGDLVKALTAFLGSDGAHTGSSDPLAASYRYALAVLTADYFLQRPSKG